MSVILYLCTSGYWLLKISAINYFLWLTCSVLCCVNVTVLSWFDPTHVEMNLVFEISFLLCPVSSRSGVIVYSNGGMKRVFINSADNPNLYKGRTGIQNELYKLEGSERSGCGNKHRSQYWKQPQHGEMFAWQQYSRKRKWTQNHQLGCFL